MNLFVLQVPPVTAKQCCEETPSAVVEVMSKDEAAGFGEPSEESNHLLPPQDGSPGGGQVEGGPGTDFKVFPDYVTLNKDSVSICPKGNKYVHEQVGEKRRAGLEDGGPASCPCLSAEGYVCGPTCLGTDFLNQSYFPLDADRLDFNVTAALESGNLYTNLPCS